MLMQSRSLLPAFLIAGLPYAWRCSVCRKLFFHGDDVLYGRWETLKWLLCEFQMHNCHAYLNCAVWDYK